MAKQTKYENIDMNTNTILNLPTPVGDSHAATKKYVDDEISPIQSQQDTNTTTLAGLTNCAKTNLSNTFTEDQNIHGGNAESNLNIRDDGGTRLQIGYNEAVGFTVGDISATPTAEIKTDRVGDIQYGTRKSSSNFGHRFFVSMSGAVSEILRIGSSGLDGLLHQAKNFANPTDPQDLTTKSYVDTLLTRIEALESVSLAGGPTQNWNWNNVTTAGAYMAANSDTNRPVGTNGFGRVIVSTNSNGLYITQLYTNSSGTSFFTRRSSDSGSTWSTWAAH